MEAHTRMEARETRASIRLLPAPTSTKTNVALQLLFDLTECAA